MFSFLGVDPAESTAWERRHVDLLDLPVVPLTDLANAPREAARAARSALPEEPFVVHVDVDVLDFIDAPIAENVNGRNSGPTIEELGEALAELVGRPPPAWPCRSVS